MDDKFCGFCKHTIRNGSEDDPNYDGITLQCIAPLPDWVAIMIGNYCVDEENLPNIVEPEDGADCDMFEAAVSSGYDGICDSCGTAVRNCIC